MNALEKWLQDSMFSDGDILEILQDFGVISDNCYKVDQVVNAEEAVEFLENKLNL